MSILSITGFLLVNSFILIPLFYMSRGLIHLASFRLDTLKERWPLNGASAAIVLVVIFLLPLGLNYLRHEERMHLTRDDRTWTGSLAGFHTIALLTDLREDGNFSMPPECGPMRCKALLDRRVVDEILVAAPPPVGAALDPHMKVTRYRFEHRAWCAPLDHIDDRRNDRNFDDLAIAAAGDCLISEPATLADADAIVIDQTFNPRNRPNFHTVHEDVIGERLSVLAREGKDWRELYRDTEIGGSDWQVPMRIGQLHRGFGGMLFGQGLIGFGTANDVTPRAIDFDGTLKHWTVGLGNASPTPAQIADEARSILADPSIPRASAAMQFLGSYPWLGGWKDKDRELSAAIIRDQRVTDFPGTSWPEVTPPALAQALLDRVLTIDPSPVPERGDLHGDRYAETVLARVFALLPACVAAPFYAPLHQLANDEKRRIYVAPMLSRLGDAGPVAIGDLELLIDSGLKAGHAMTNKFNWSKGDGLLVLSGLQGFARLGPPGAAATSLIIATLNDDLTTGYAANGLDFRRTAWAALTNMGEEEMLRGDRGYAAQQSMDYWKKTMFLTYVDCRH